MQAIKVEREIGGRMLTISTGTFAKLAGGSVTVQYGDTVVFGAVVRANPREGIDNSTSTTIGTPSRAAARNSHPLSDASNASVRSGRRAPTTPRP